jgi:hypothetical protein
VTAEREANGDVGLYAVLREGDADPALELLEGGRPVLLCLIHTGMSVDDATAGLTALARRRWTHRPRLVVPD